MQDVIAPVENIVFDIEIALNNQLGAQPLPFPGMDSKQDIKIPDIMSWILKA